MSSVCCGYFSGEWNEFNSGVLVGHRYRYLQTESGREFKHDDILRRLFEAISPVKKPQRRGVISISGKKNIKIVILKSVSVRINVPLQVNA